MIAILSWRVLTCRLNFDFSQMVLNLDDNPDISDAGWAKLLGCLGNVEKLWLYDDCNVSDGMRRKLMERGREVGCDVVG